MAGRQRGSNVRGNPTGRGRGVSRGRGASTSSGGGRDQGNQAMASGSNLSVNNSIHVCGLCSSDVGDDAIDDAILTGITLLPNVQD